MYSKHVWKGGLRVEGGRGGAGWGKTCIFTVLIYDIAWQTCLQRSIYSLIHSALVSTDLNLDFSNTRNLSFLSPSS